MQNPFQAQAMIHSLNSKRDVLILSFEDINPVSYTHLTLPTTERV